MPQVLDVNPALPVKNVRELIALAKARPGQLTYATSGAGGTGHMATELFARQVGIKMLHIPYKGNAQAIIDVIGGQVMLMFDQVSTSEAYIKAGKLRAIAVSSLTRSPLTPNVPTVAELGYPGYEAIVWFGLFAPANTPPDIVKKIHEDTARILAVPAMREVLASQGTDIVASTPAQFGTYVTSEIAKWRKVIQDAGVKPE